MNAIPPDPEQAERTARHLAMLRELSEIGMALARAIGEQALAALETPSPSDPQAVPTAPAPNRTDPGLAFARVARAVRQCIALEARIAAGPLPAARGRGAPRPAPDPRRETVRRVVRLAAEADGLSAATLKRDIEERLDEELDADPDGEIEVEDHIAAILGDLGLGRNLARQPDEVLAILIRPRRLDDDFSDVDMDEPAEADAPEAAAAGAEPGLRPGRAPPPPLSCPAGPDPP
ncbi:MAG TPA: hypothetical protein VHY76_05220 [Acetobacteraceae bacterium]|nr:hypothetical protein [Acetobacteraceae bacterium]